MNNKSKISLATLVFLAACTDHPVHSDNSSRLGSSLQLVTTSTYDIVDELCPATCETDFECCPDYLAWYEESVALATTNPECELSCCEPLSSEEDLVCRDETLTSK